MSVSEKGRVSVSEEIQLMFSKDGKAAIYDPTYDITIHCESKEEQEKAIKAINRVKWIYCSKRLPEEPSPGLHEMEEFKEYNVVIKDATVPTTLFYIGNGEWYREGSYYNVEKWAYLPEP